MLTKDGWKLVGSMRWVPCNPDVKETCPSCLCRGRSNYDWDNKDCTDCCGNGFRYVIKDRGQQPEVSEHLAQWMRDSYNEWEELYGYK